MTYNESKIGAVIKVTNRDFYSPHISVGTEAVIIKIDNDNTVMTRTGLNDDARSSNWFHLINIELTDSNKTAKDFNIILIGEETTYHTKLKRFYTKDRFIDLEYMKTSIITFENKVDNNGDWDFVYQENQTLIGCQIVKNSEIEAIINFVKQLNS